MDLLVSTELRRVETTGLKTGDRLPFLEGSGANFLTDRQASDKRGGENEKGRETHGNKSMETAPEPTVQEPKP